MAMDSVTRVFCRGCGSRGVENFSIQETGTSIIYRIEETGRENEIVAREVDVVGGKLTLECQTCDSTLSVPDSLEIEFI